MCVWGLGALKSTFLESLECRFAYVRLGTRIERRSLSARAWCSRIAEDLMNREKSDTRKEEKEEEDGTGVANNPLAAKPREATVEVV